MATFLFNSIIFGPVNSRRLGVSLGINLLPLNKKICNFDCIYCECGLNEISKENTELPTPENIKLALEEQLQEMQKNKLNLDAITFAGNGEPCLHPGFAQIIDDTIFLRNKYFPDVKIVVLSNAILSGETEIKNALLKTDQAVLKLDTALAKTFKLINRAANNISLNKIIENLKSYKGNFVLQTLFLKGEINGIQINNTSEEELEAWLNVVKELKPKLVMVYTIARSTPIEKLQKIPLNILENIGERISKLGIPVQITE